MASFPNPPKEELEKLSAKLLSTLLKERGLKCTGNKNALVNRLHTFSNTIIEASVTALSTKPKYCCVPVCSNNSKSEGIRLHRIPMGQQRKTTRRLWIQRLRNVRANATAQLE